MPAKKGAFTYFEVLIVFLIFGVVLAALFITLNAGYFTQALSSQEVELQSTVRLASEWAAKDLRQAIVGEIVKVQNSPSTSHLKFNLGTWNTTTHTWDISATDYIEYTYDSQAKKLTRTYVFTEDEITKTMTLAFNNLIEAPFYTRYDGPGDPDNTLNTTDLSNNKKLIVVLRGEKTVRGTEKVSYAMVSQILIRNE